MPTCFLLYPQLRTSSHGQWLWSLASQRSQQHGGSSSQRALYLQRQQRQQRQPRQQQQQRLQQLQWRRRRQACRLVVLRLPPCPPCLMTCIHLQRMERRALLQVQVQVQLLLLLLLLLMVMMMVVMKEAPWMAR